MANKYKLAKTEKKAGKITMTFSLQEKDRLARIPSEISLEMTEKELKDIMPAPAKPAPKKAPKKDEA